MVCTVGSGQCRSCGVVDWIGRLLNEQPVAWFDSWSHRVCQENEDLSVPLSMSCLCVDVLYLIFDYFCHVVVCSLFHVSTMSKVAVKLLVEKCFVPMSAVALCSGR